MPNIPSSAPIGDIAQLQRQIQSQDTAIRELSANVSRLTNLLNTIIDLNNLKSKP